MPNRNKLTTIKEITPGKWNIMCRQCVTTYIGPDRDTYEEAREDRINHRKFIHNPEFLQARYLSEHGIDIKRIY